MNSELHFVLAHLRELVLILGLLIYGLILNLRPNIKHGDRMKKFRNGFGIAMIMCAISPLILLSHNFLYPNSN